MWLDTHLACDRQQAHATTTTKYNKIKEKNKKHNEQQKYGKNDREKQWEREKDKMKSANGIL